MSNQFDGNGNQKLHPPLENHSRNILTDENRLRRLIEIQRRIRALHVKRNHLKNELQAMEKCLMSLHNQLKSHEAHSQLTLTQ